MRNPHQSLSADPYTFSANQSQLKPVNPHWKPQEKCPQKYISPNSIHAVLYANITITGQKSQHFISLSSIRGCYNIDRILKTHSGVG